MAKPAQPIVDVNHPGKTPPPSSSRSIIVTNRPIMQDPDVKAPAADTDSVSSAPQLELAAKEHKQTPVPPSQKKVVLTPPSEAKESSGEAITVTVKSSTGAAKAADSIPEVTPEPTPTEEPKPEPEPKEKPAAKPAPANNQDAPIEEDEAADVKPIKDEKQLAAEAAQAAKVAGLIKREVYVLPINAVEKRRSKHVVIGGLLLIIVLALVWLDLAADAGFIHVPHLPLTHFFRI